MTEIISNAVVHRQENRTQFTIIANEIFKRNDMSALSRLMLCQILSLPKEWHYTVKGLSTLFKEGINAVRSALNELIECGYAVRIEGRNDKGYKEYFYHFYEVMSLNEHLKDIVTPISIEKQSTEITKNTEIIEEDTSQKNLSFQDTDSKIRIPNSGNSITYKIYTDKENKNKIKNDIYNTISFSKEFNNNEKPFSKITYKQNNNMGEIFEDSLNNSVKKKSKKKVKTSAVKWGVADLYLQKMSESNNAEAKLNKQIKQSKPQMTQEEAKAARRRKQLYAISQQRTTNKSLLRDLDNYIQMYLETHFMLSTVSWNKILDKLYDNTDTDEERSIKIQYATVRSWRDIIYREKVKKAPLEYDEDCDSDDYFAKDENGNYLTF